MEEKIYGVLKAKVTVINDGFISKKHKSHFNLITNEIEEQYRINIDLQSDRNKPNVKVLCIENYKNPIVQKLEALTFGFVELIPKKSPLALDYLREHLFPKEKLFLSEAVSHFTISEMLDKSFESFDYAVTFGTVYRNQSNKKNNLEEDTNIKGTQTYLGIDNIHFNQGNISAHTKSNGIYHDGAIFVKQKDKTYNAYFFCFVEQCYKTDDNGNCLA